jgi:hypothetical protein
LQSVTIVFSYCCFIFYQRDLFRHARSLTLLVALTRYCKAFDFGLKGIKTISIFSP